KVRYCISNILFRFHKLRHCAEVFALSDDTCTGVLVQVCNFHLDEEMASGKNKYALAMTRRYSPCFQPSIRSALLELKKLLLPLKSPRTSTVGKYFCLSS